MDHQEILTLRTLPRGERAVITRVGGEGALRQHFLDMGLLPEAEVKIIKYAPLGDPMVIEIHGYELSLRLEDAARIEVRKTDKKSAASRQPRERNSGIEPEFEAKHPGLGEGGKYHDKEHEHPLPDSTWLTFALAGNQNTGKTTLFNQLTGANQHVGNFPGVTVEQKSGPILNRHHTRVTDLPGIYSLSPYSSEELVSRRFILGSHPKAIINIVDATNIERNLYLTLQLMELDVPMVLALNFVDELTANEGAVYVNEMERLLGVPCVPCSAKSGEGIEELVEHAVHVAKYQEPPLRQDFCSKDDHGGAVHRCIHAVMHLIEDHAQKYRIPLRFAASKLIEGDSDIEAQLHLDQNERDTVEHLILQMEKERGLDRAAAIADMRFSFIGKLVAKCVVKPEVSLQRVRSERIDSILTGKWTAVPAFVAIMALVFWLTFFVIGTPLQDLLDEWIGNFNAWFGEKLSEWQVNDVVRSLIVDGVLAGCGTVASFVPLIVTLFFFLSMLEDSGYMARVAFVMDSFLRKIGLSGRSIVPMLIGFGCSVPAVMATRTLPSERDRKLTILMVPFMSCTAKLPIYAFFCAAFFPEQAWLVMLSLYIIGIIVGIMFALCSKTTLFKGEPVPFVMELPNYRMPGARNTLRLLWDKARDFLERAFTVIFLATIVIWFLQTFDFRFNVTEDQSRSMLAVISGHIAPIFHPLGFGDWRMATALVSGFMAKESVVSTLEVLYGNFDITALLSTASVFSFLVFCLLYTPCVAAMASVKRELGTKSMLGIILLQCTIAWIVSFLVYELAVLVGA
mgnify:CR=1 FL=1